MSSQWRNSTPVVVGCSQTRLGKLKKPLSALVAEAVEAALRDAGIDAGRLDGIVAMPALATDKSRPLRLMEAHQIATDLGLLTRAGGQDMVCKTIDCGGASPVAALREACSLIDEGTCACVAVVGADAVASMTTTDFLERVSGNRNGSRPIIPEKYDDFAQWHAQTHGTTREDLARVPVFMSAQASCNANAMAYGKKVLDVGDVLRAPRVAPSTTLLECARRADGAAVLIVADGRQMASARGVPILGTGEASGPMNPDQSYVGAHCLRPIGVAAQRALERSGALRADEIDWFGLYDCFPVAFLSALEHVGLAPMGKGGAWVRDALKRLERGEKINVNTHGGLLGAGAPWEAPAMFAIVEAVMQLRGEAGPRQVGRVRTALVQANGGTFSHEAVVVLGRKEHAQKAKL